MTTKDSDSAGVTEASEPRPPEQSSNGRSRGVLLVVQEPDLQWRLARMLTVHGNRVVGTSSGDGALALMAQWPVDVMLIETGLPGVDCLELVRRMRSTQPSKPIVLIGGDEEASTQLTTDIGGAVAYLAKPLRTQRLLEVLEELQPTPSRPRTGAQAPVDRGEPVLEVFDTRKGR